MQNELVAVILKNDHQAKKYLTDHFTDTEVFVVDESLLGSDEGIEKVYEEFKTFAQSLCESITVACGVGNLDLVTKLCYYAIGSGGYFYMLEPQGLIKIA